jgi:hypothetical protein
MSMPPIRDIPAYQEYASDLIAKKHYRLMSLQERGLFFTIRLECWVNRSVPSDPLELAKYLGFHEDDITKNLTSNLLHFLKVEDRVLICPELNLYRERVISTREKKSEGGKKGGLQTQEIHRKNQANLKDNLKLLNRGEMTRKEKKGDELIDSEGFSEETDEFLAGLGANYGEEYTKQSNGF